MHSVSEAICAKEQVEICHWFKIEYINKPEKLLPHWRSTPSTAAAIALPCSAAFSILEMASQRHFVISSMAMTSPFSTTGRCLNFPIDKNSNSIRCHLINLQTSSFATCHQNQVIYLKCARSNHQIFIRIKQYFKSFWVLLIESFMQYQKRKSSAQVYKKYNKVKLLTIYNK